MRKIKAVLYDFDGPVLNSTSESMQRILELIEFLKINYPDNREFRDIWGAPWPIFVKRLADICNWNSRELAIFLETCKEKRNFWKKHKVFPNMKEVLEKLKLRGIQVAIISSRTKQAPKEDLFSIMYYLKSNNVDPNVFFFIQGREDCEQVKPNPQVFFPITGILENQDISWKEVIYVGDTINYDLESTKRHHPQISFVGMDCGAADKVDFMKAGISKECIINSPEQIFRAIDFYEKN